MQFNVHIALQGPRRTIQKRCLVITKAIQRVNTQFSYALSRLMTHHHVNIKSNDSTLHAMTQPYK